MIRACCALFLLGLVLPLQAAEFKPFHVLSLSGTAALMRFEDEPWPLEPGQDLPGDLTLSLEPGAALKMRIQRRVDLTVAGPAKLRFFSLEKPQGQELQRQLLIRVEYGALALDPRCLLGRPSNIVLELPDTSFEVPGGLPFLSKSAAGKRSAFALGGQELVPVERKYGNFEPAKAGARPRWPDLLVEAATDPIAVLVVARDFDRQTRTWPRPAVLGRALVDALKPLPGLRLVEGSGSTTLAYHLNAVLRSGEDPFLQDFAEKRGARWVVAGNLVVDRSGQASPGAAAASPVAAVPQVAATAELRVIEALQHGDELATESALSVTPRAGVEYAVAARQVLESAAERAAQMIQNDLEVLLQGRSHAPRLVGVTFYGMDLEAQRELRRILGSLGSVRQFFRRSFSQGALKMDLILRGSDAEFLDAFLRADWHGFEVSREPGSPSGGMVFTFRPARLDKGF